MRIALTKTFDFEAAHWLPTFPEGHKCRRMHGHSFKIDVVVEGEAVRVRDEARLARIAAAYVAKYGSDWQFDVRDGAFAHGESTALVFEVAPVKAFGFAKGAFSQTRWRFARS